jgi:hypothetical protein
MTYREYLEFKRAFAAFLKREEIRDFSSADSEADTYFSWHPVRLLRSPARRGPGRRYRAA